VQQSNFIFGALAVAFIIFVTLRGSLPKYLEVIFGGGVPDGGKTIDAPADQTDFRQMLGLPPISERPN
jgi:hypothetical protein